MAILNKEEGCVVLRIVYAGAPLSGKTESLRSLSGLLYGERRGEEEFYSPDHTDGRTLYFDWLNYIGGYFKGYKVNCQLISVPGQKTLKKRRKLLLEMADVVVFVVDSEAGKLETAQNYYQEMQPWLKRMDEPPVGVVIQANKRDSITALPIPEIYEAFQDNPNLLVLETIATKNSGIREAFVTGVRIGLERATWLINNDRMETGVSELSCGEALLNLIQTQEEAERLELSQHHLADKLAAQAIKQTPKLDLSANQFNQIIHEEIKLKESVVTASEPREVKNDHAQETPPSIVSHTDSSNFHLDQKTGTLEQTIDANNATVFAPNDNKSASQIKQPALPDKDVIAGNVFPPITGRIILHKLADGDVTIEQTYDGSWEASIGDQWRLLSRAGDSFPSPNDARMHLVHYANTHKKLGPYLSEHRCMAIVPSDGGDEWRVWQIVRNEATLSEMLHVALMGHFPHRIAEEVYEIAEKYVGAHKFFTESDLNLPFHFNNIAINQNKPVFTGYITQQTNAAETDTPPLEELVKKNFKPLISKALHDNPILSLGIPYVLHPLEGFGRANPEMKLVVEILRTLFIGEH